MWERCLQNISESQCQRSWSLKTQKGHETKWCRQKVQETRSSRDYKTTRLKGQETIRLRDKKFKRLKDQETSDLVDDIEPEVVQLLLEVSWKILFVVKKMDDEISRW